MRVAHDIFAETNPAFYAYALVSFVAAHLTVNDQGPDLPVVYISLPIALSGEFSDTFDGTNKNTGLLEWLGRSPQVQIGLAERVNASMGLITDAVRFGCFLRVLSLSANARLLLGDQKVKRSVVSTLSNETAQSLKRAERLGYWFASAGSTKTAFDIMGLAL